MALKIYAVFLLVFFSCGLIFYIMEYVRRGGTQREAMYGALKLLIFFFPLPVVVFFQSANITWPNQLMWRLYGLCFVVQCLQMAFSAKYRKPRQNFLRLWQGDILVGSLVFGVFFILVAPAFAILWTYAF